MSKLHHFNRLNLQAFAQAGMPAAETTPLQMMDRLAQEALSLGTDSAVSWTAVAELRPGLQAEQSVWLHLTASALVSLTCQRCMGMVGMPLEVDQWYRFVATEAIAMAEDDESEEDLLVMEPQFDLLALLEDELLMALPLVPMHGECPVAPAMQVGEEALVPVASENGDDRRLGEKPHPFAALAQLKTKND